MNRQPIATYRLQLHKDFTFQDAAQISDYLKSLNISHLYLSPVLSSAPGSNHGYDGTDFAHLSEERGGEKSFRELAEKISSYERPLGMIIDIVPNHMTTHPDNPYWMDLLKNGSQSPYWDLFDLKIKPGQKIQLPVLTADIQDCLKDFKIIETGKNRFIEYQDIQYPVNDRSLDTSNINSLLENQYYEFKPWSKAADGISYRRFFDVMSLIAVKVDQAKIFDATHQKILELAKEHSCINGVRIDHIDGLADPKAYLDMLSKYFKAVWIEKIVSRSEEINPAWKTEGTTGYEFIDRLNQLLIHQENFKEIQKFWAMKTQATWENFEDCVLEGKKQVLDESFNPELERLVKLSCNKGQDPNKTRIFWKGLTLGLSIYRVYKEDDLKNNRWIQKSSIIARKLFPDYRDAEKIFLPDLLSPKTEKDFQILTEWQQLSGPVMAKGLEDTAHYRYTPLLALNEVGCTPNLHTDKNDFFVWQTERAKNFPSAMNATSTHDTKRSEDTRHRLYALADMPEKWIQFFDQAITLSAPSKTALISTGHEYFIHQTILGTWPFDQKPDTAYEERLQAYFVKAFREAKQATNWITPNEEFEKSIKTYVFDIFNNQTLAKLINNFTKDLSSLGALNSLTVTTLKILSLGLPDIYQGMESWEFNLVDPDNRRPVDYKKRQDFLTEAENIERDAGRLQLLTYLTRNWQSGMIKAWLTRELLHIRQNHIYLWDSAELKTLDVSGKGENNLIAYQLGNETSGLIVLCPRYPGLMKRDQHLGLDWGDTEIKIPPSELFDLIKQEPVAANTSVKDLLRQFPISVLLYK